MMILRLYKIFRRWELERSIRKSGIYQPIIALEDGTILNGNNRRVIALKLGLKEVPVIFIHGKLRYVDPLSLKTERLPDKSMFER